MKRKKCDIPECSQIAIEHRASEGVSDDLILESKHKIFLSHSGIQKEFVEHLCKALEDRCHYPFFDRRPESLPKGEQFPSLIVKAAQQCQLLVVVVSEEYFMSKWPMIELNAFVQASKVLKSNKNVAILPLFYGLSISELKDEKKRQRWYEKWETFVKDDGRIKVEDWCYALDELTKFNGLSYDRELKEIVAYENAIVSHICRLVPPDIKWDDSHVQGNAHEVVLEKRKEINLSPKYKVKVLGIYGVGGIGKTTMCRRLCNDLPSEYEGRVCHVEFDVACSNSKELLQKASIELIKKQVEVVQQLGEGECINILKKNLFKHKTFLALDNVWDNDNSIKQALLFLNLGFHEESFVVVTARSQSTLERLGIVGLECLEMPELGQVEATRLFLHCAANGRQFSSRDMLYIKECVAKCYFHKGDGRGFHYHPLALEVLGRQLGCLGEMPCEWVQKLGTRLGENVVFDVLKIGFNLLQPREQALFMDIGLFVSPKSWSSLGGLYGINGGLFGWREHLSVVQKLNDGDIQSRMDNLTSKGLLQDSNFSSGKINIHDLYIEFVKLEAKGNLDETIDMWDRRWVYVDDGDLSELEVTPAGGCWSKLTRLCIWQDFIHCANPLTSLEGIEWQYFSNVLVLHLEGLTSVQGTLNLKGMKCLRSLRVRNVTHLERLEGLSGLTKLTMFEWDTYLSSLLETRETYFVGCFPASLKFLNILGKYIVLEPKVLARCNLLCKLYLRDVDVGELLDLSSFFSLDSVELSFLLKRQTVLVLCTSRASKLKFLVIRWEYSGLTREFIDISVVIPGLDQAVGLEHLHLYGSRLQGLPSLLPLTNLQSLKLEGHGRLPELCVPQQVYELHLIKGSYKAPNLNGFKQLQILNLFMSHQVTHMFGMGDLSALRSIDLKACKCLERLPDLSKSRSLEELNLDGCLALQLHEEDIQMLATLPLLHPVRFSKVWGVIRLDFVRQKVLRHQGPTFGGLISWLTWKEGELKEDELGQPPIGIFL